MLLSELLEASVDSMQQVIDKLKNDIRSVNAQLASVSAMSPVRQTLQNKQKQLTNQLQVAKNKLGFINDQPNRDVFKQQSREFDKQLDLTQREKMSRASDAEASDGHNSNSTNNFVDPEHSGKISKALLAHFKRMEEHGDWDGLIAGLENVAKEINPDKFDFQKVADAFGVQPRTVYKWLARPQANELRKAYRIRPFKRRGRI